ncbi:MAG TPA: RNA 2',3'-cyclic phosphodiesterase [Actinomycetota bacterium]|nr:RNA 2',3'-cyclic phosphodiesterase [Actinomycetota bacterium]
MSLRLFVAADVPPEHLASVEEAVGAWQRTLSGARWTDPSGRHVTLKFLGSVAEERLEGVLEAASIAARSCVPGRARLSGFGAFPSTRRMRVLWVGLDDLDGSLACLATALDRGFEALGVEPEKRSFTAHLTVARFRNPSTLPEGASGIDLRSLPPFEVDRAVLYRSHLSAKGARYEALASLPLGEGNVPPR